MAGEQFPGAEKRYSLIAECAAGVEESSPAIGELTLYTESAGMFLAHINFLSIFTSN
jgi:hypothetical protein